MRIASILIIFGVILCTGCSDKEPPEKDTVKKVVTEKTVADESVTKLEIEMPIYTSLLEISRDVKHGNEDKWKDKWIIFEGHVARNEILEEMLYLYRSSGDICIIIDNNSNPRLHKYQADRTYIFSTRVIDLEHLGSGSGFSSTILKLEDKGKLIIPPDYMGTIDVDLNVLANDVKQGGHEKWIGKKVRFTGKVRVISEEEGELHIVNPDFDVFNIFELDNFDFAISGFGPNSNKINEYENGKIYTFTVKIESLDPNLLILLRRYELMSSIIDE